MIYPITNKHITMLHLNPINEAISTLYKVWANYHKQAGESKFAIFIEYKAFLVLEEAAKLLKNNIENN